MFSRLSSEITTHFLSGWLDWTDIVRLDSASSYGLHLVIEIFMQSHTFREIYSESFGMILECDEKATETKSLRLLRRLEWISHRQISIKYCTACIVPQHLAALERLKQATQYRFVKKLIIQYDDITSYSQLISVVMERFPLIDDLSVIGNSCPKEILRALLVICRYCPIHSVFLGTNGMFELDTRHLVSKMVTVIGDKLKSFQVPLKWVIPHEIVQCVADHCPRIEHMFSNCHLDTSFTIDSYMAMCRKMSKLQELNIGTNGFIMTDDHLCAIVNSLPSLKVVKILNNSLTILSMLRALEHCPDIQEISLSHISWKLKTFSQNSSIQCESSLFFHGILTEEMKTLAFSQFVQAIPILSELSFQSHFEILSSHFLHEALSTKHSVNVTRISLYLDCLENFEQLSNIVALCQNLRHLTLNVVCKGQIRCPHIDFFVNMVCKHCSNLCTLSLTDLINIDNTHVTIMVDRLPTLHTVLLPSGAHKVDRSTLFHMAQTQRQWEHLNLWGTAVDVKDIVQALELHHLQVKKLEHKYEGGLCSVGYGRVNMRIVDVIASIF